jgi:hypothetical protein
VDAGARADVPSVFPLTPALSPVVRSCSFRSLFPDCGRTWIRFRCTRLRNWESASLCAGGLFRRDRGVVCPRATWRRSRRQPKVDDRLPPAWEVTRPTICLPRAVLRPAKRPSPADPRTLSRLGWWLLRRRRGSTDLRGHLAGDATATNSCLTAAVQFANSILVECPDDTHAVPHVDFVAFGQSSQRCCTSPDP